MVQAVPILQARLPYFPSLDGRPHPTVSPPDPASGPRVGGDGQEYAEGFGGGDKFLRGQPAILVRWPLPTPFRSFVSDT